MDKMEDVKEKVETMIGDTPKHLGLVVSLDDIDKDSLSGLQKEEFKEIASDLKKIGIELKIDSGHLVLGYDKGKEGIINWDDYPIRVPEEKVKNVDMKGAGKVEQEMNKEEILNQDKEFKYKLLDRMRSDCEYYLSYGNKDAKYLWAGNEKEQIETMRAIYNSFSQNEKPEWITLEQIDGFEKEMLKMEKEQEINTNEIQIEPEVEKRNMEQRLDWHIIHEADADNGQPTQWSAKLTNGEFLWIDKEARGYALYDTHISDASPVSVSETLEEAKESGENYNMEQENLNAVWEMQEMLESPIFNICEQGIRDKDILYKIAQQYNLSENSTESISAAMENQIVQQAFENDLVVKNLLEKLKRYSGDTAFAPVQEDIENYFEYKKGEIENALELYKNCVKSAFEAGFSIDNVYGAINNGVCVYDNREVDLVSYDGEAATLDDIYNKIEYYRNERDEREEKLEVIHIKELKSEIVKLEASINGSKIEQEKIPLVQEEIKDKYMQLRNKTTNLLENADSEKLNNPDFLENINVDKINGVYVHKECIEGWTAVVTMNDILKMEEKNGLSSLEFKGCEIKCAMFNKKFEDCTFENCNLLSCTFENVEFVNTTFKAVTFYDNVLQNVKFKDCKFVDCDNIEMIPFTNPHTEKSNNIEFINTEIKDSKVYLNRADTNLDLKSVRFKNCSIENLECCIDKTNYQSQLITKKINSEKTLMKLLGRDLKKSLKLGETTMSKKKQRRAKAH